VVPTILVILLACLGVLAFDRLIPFRTKPLRDTHLFPVDILIYAGILILIFALIAWGTVNERLSDLI
jgi:hypothetical protein